MYSALVFYTELEGGIIFSDYETPPKKASFYMSHTVSQSNSIVGGDPSERANLLQMVYAEHS